MAAQACMLASTLTASTSGLSVLSAKPSLSKSRRVSVGSNARCNLLPTRKSETKKADADADANVLRTLFGASGMAAASAFLSTPSAQAAQEIAMLADDTRSLSLLLVLAPALGFVLFIIAQPALRQFDKMRGVKNVAGAVGLGAAASLLAAPQADAAQEIALLAADNRPLFLLALLLPTVGFVAFIIIQPALRQFEKMQNNIKKK